MLGMEWAWMAVAAPLAAFVAIVLFGRYLPGKGSWLAILAVAFGFVIFWFALAGLVSGGPGHFQRAWFQAGDAVVRLGMTVDPLAVLMMGVVTFVALMVQVYSLAYMKGDPRFGWYFAAHSLFAAAMLGLVLADNYLVLYVAWELVGLCSYLLIGFWYERRSAAEAAKKAFVTTRIGDVGFLIAVILLWRLVGSFQISDVIEAVKDGTVSQGMATVIALLIFAGAAGKSAQFPLHVWLPDAMEGPTPVSALIHAATMVAAGVYLVARSFPIFEAGPASLHVVAGIGLTTALLAGSMGLVETDIKRILAYSTVSQLGFMMLALGSGGYTGGMFHLLTHASFKALLFLGAGSIIHSLHKQDLREVSGLGRRMPITMATFVLASLALAGLPPLSGFWSKDEILAVVLEHQSWPVYALTLVAAVLSVLYMARLAFVVFFGKPRPEDAKVHESPPAMALPLLALAVPSALAGLLALPWLSAYQGFGTFLFPPGHEPEPYAFHATVALASILIAVVGLAWGWLQFRQGLTLVPVAWERRLAPLYQLVKRKYYMDDLYQWAINRVVLAFSNLIALFDRAVVNDKGVNSSGRLATATGWLLRYHETGQVSNYFLVIALGMLLILGLAVLLT